MAVLFKEVAVWKWLSVVFTTVVMLFLLFRFVSVERLLANFQLLNGYWVFLGVVAFLFGHLLRYFRYRIMWCWPNSSALAAATAFHGVISYLLPLRLGEFALPFLVKKYSLQSFSKLFFGIIWVRLFDFLVIAIIGLAICLIPSLREQLLDLMRIPSQSLFHSEVLVPLLAVPLLVALVLIGQFVMYKALDKGSESRRFVFTTMLIWCSVLLMNGAFAEAVGFRLDIVGLLMLLVLQVLLYFLPLQGLAGLGAHQLAWVAVLVSQGASPDQALSLSIMTHILVLFSVGILLILAMILAFRASRQRQVPG
mgnify:CR=1 FL=1